MWIFRVFSREPVNEKLIQYLQSIRAILGGGEEGAGGEGLRGDTEEGVGGRGPPPRDVPAAAGGVSSGPGRGGGAGNLRWWLGERHAPPPLSPHLQINPRRHPAPSPATPPSPRKGNNLGVYCFSAAAGMEWIVYIPPPRPPPTAVRPQGGSRAPRSPATPPRSPGAGGTGGGVRGKRGGGHRPPTPPRGGAAGGRTAALPDKGRAVGAAPPPPPRVPMAAGSLLTASSRRAGKGTLTAPAQGQGWTRGMGGGEHSGGEWEGAALGLPPSL